MIYKKLENYSRYLFDSDGNIYRIRKEQLQKLKLSLNPNGYLYKNLWDDFGKMNTLRCTGL